MPAVPTVDMLKAWQRATQKNPYCVGRNHAHSDGRQWEFCERVDYATRPDTDEFVVLERFATEDEVVAHRDLAVAKYAYQEMMAAAPAGEGRQMSHADYLARCDEDQLICLVEMANGRLEQIRQTGWVKLWVVSDDCINLGWFEQPDYRLALDFLSEAGMSAASKNKTLELGVRLAKYRPDEAAALVAETLSMRKAPAPAQSGD